MLLPNNYTIVTALDSQWSAVFTLTNDDGTLADITNKVFEFVIRDRLGGPGMVLASVNSAVSTAFGVIIVNLIQSSIEVILTPTAISMITNGGAPYTLWMDQNLSDATALVTGTIYANPVALP